VLLALPGIGLLTENERASAQVAERPNIVFVMTDDQAESTLAHMSNVKGLLKDKGLTFANAFNVYPLCCPSRAIIQRGQYAHNTEIFGNGPANYGNNGGYEAFDARDLEKSTLATWLHDAGYRTLYLGGKYMNNFDPQVHPPPPGWDVFSPHTTRHEDENVTTANSAMAQLRQDAPNAQPFFMQVDFMAPHVPNNYESQFATMFAGEQVPRVPSFDEQDVADKPRYIRQDKPPLSQQTNPHVHDLCQDNEVNSIEQNDCEYARQLRNLQTVDRFIKDMTDYLAAQGELSNTYIVYYTDNGNHWGEHRLDFGKMAPYETDTGFPLLIRGPSVPEGAVSSKLIGNHDIAPTFAQMARASTPPFVDGRSFLRLADADPTNDSPWRTGLYVERRYKPEWKLPSKQDSGQYVPPYEGVREENLIYVRYHDDPWTAVNDAGFREFYDLSTDPHELRNLAYYGEVPQATLDRLEGRLLRLRGCKAEACRAAEDEPTTGTTTPPPTDPPPPSTACTITGTTNAETLSGTPGADVICGGGGNDTVKGLGGNDTLRGEAGNDTLLGGVGDDTLDGGTGNDTASYAASLTAVTASLATNPATGEGSDTFLGVENLLGSSKADTLTGSQTNNKLTGGGGADTERGGLGDDQVIGSGGADVLYGEDGADTVNSKDGVSGNDSLDGGAGTDTKTTDATEKSIVGFP
jgi:N-acetylglucosamine-6-sulfatase